MKDGFVTGGAWVLGVAKKEGEHGFEYRFEH